MHSSLTCGVTCGRMEISRRYPLNLFDSQAMHAQQLSPLLRYQLRVEYPSELSYYGLNEAQTADTLSRGGCVLLDAGRMAGCAMCSYDPQPHHRTWR